MVFKFLVEAKIAELDHRGGLSMQIAQWRTVGMSLWHSAGQKQTPTAVKYFVPKLTFIMMA